MSRRWPGRAAASHNLHASATDDEAELPDAPDFQSQLEAAFPLEILHRGFDYLGPEGIGFVQNGGLRRALGEWEDSAIERMRNGVNKIRTPDEIRRLIGTSGKHSGGYSLHATGHRGMIDELRPSGKAVVLLSAIRQLPYIRDPGGETGATLARLDGMLDVTLSLPVTEQGPLLVELAYAMRTLHEHGWSDRFNKLIDTAGALPSGPVPTCSKRS
jgi:hypothetical protein